MSEENKNPQPQEGAKKPEQKGAPRRRLRTVAFARVYVNCSFNNTIITFTDEKGGVIAWSTSGGNGFRGTKKGTPFAAQITASKAAARASEYGVRQAMVFVSGPGPGRETAIRAVAQSGIHVVSIKDVTPIPHNGCRPPKARRV
ncbi:MAG: 30S ribosomal protein S11 [Elusimicrobia bacterium HGW-Elusimicrobia-3]|jgi:small subunit ribosomal protein S11|nr:MAG: 30S ribosomal protein S11 [Elusimicrobia bacterium HGW-Elusimicrobia-3]